MKWKDFKIRGVLIEKYGLHWLPDPDTPTIYLFDLPNGAKYYSSISFEYSSGRRLNISFFKWNDFKFWVFEENWEINSDNQLEVFRSIYRFINEVEGFEDTGSVD